MKKSIADKWVEALRSGKYKQGEGFLHSESNNTYCCLGVLCEIEGIPFNGNRIMPFKNGILKTGNGEILGDGTLLSNLNDGRGRLITDDIIKLNFDEIADIIQIN